MMTKAGRSVKAAALFLFGFSSMLSFASATLNPAVPTAASPKLDGQSRTLLPDGRVLFLGGIDSGKVSKVAFVEDSKTGEVGDVPMSLLHGRAFHSATVLPDGKVLIFGGTAEGTSAQAPAELFDPASQTFTELSTGDLQLRAHHTATLLTDGKVLLAGGTDSEGKNIGRLDLWDYRSGLSTSLTATLSPAPAGHTAALQPDGSVFCQGGHDASQSPMSYGFVLDTIGPSVRFVSKAPEFLFTNEPPTLEASIPQSGETLIPVDQLIALRFSKEMDVATISNATIILRTYKGEVAVNVVSAEEGMLAFVTPKAPLAAGTVYTLSISGAADPSGRQLSSTTIVFTTETAMPVNLLGENVASAAAASGWGSTTVSPGATNSPWRKLPMLPGRRGVTSLAGQVLKLDGNPLANVLIEINSHRASTDESGRFLLEDLGPGHHVMLVDGAPATENGNTYGIYRVGVDLIEGKTNSLNYTVWMTALDTEHVVKIPSPTTADLVVTNPLVPGLELHIPKGTVIHDARGRVVTQVGITPIPTLQPPFPLKRGAVFPVYFTIQPGGATFATTERAGPTLASPKDTSKPRGATIHYENHYGAKAGVRFAFWNYDPAQKGWYVYGHGRVSDDAKMIHPEDGTQIYSFDGAMVSLPSNAPPNGPKQNNPEGGDPVDLQTGLFVYTKADLALKDVLPLLLSRTYRQADYTSRAFGIGTSMPYDMFLVGDAQGTAEGYTYQDLVLADGGRVHFTRTSPCTGSNNYCDYTNAVYTATSTPGPFYGATLYYSGCYLCTSNFWTITRKDGMVYLFPDSENASVARQAAVTSMRDRNGNTVTFTRDYNSNLTQITSPNGRWIQLTYDSSNRVIQAQDNIGRTTSYTYNPAGYLATATDAKGGVTTYTYDSSGNMLTIKDPRQIVYLQNQYDVNDMVYQQTSADGGVYQFSYTLDANSNITQTNVTDPRGYLRTVIFNADGYMTGDTRAVGAPERQVTTYNVQQGTGLLLSKTDALNRTTAYSYDALANATSVTMLYGTSNAATTALSYVQPFSKLASVTDPLGHTSSLTYDNNGNVLSINDALGNTTSFAYNSAGQPTTVTDALGNQALLTYQSGVVSSFRDSLGRTVSWFIDNAGRASAVIDPLGNSTHFNLDPFDQATAITDPLGNQTTIAYDPNGNALTITDANQHTTTNVFDVMDRVSTTKDSLGNQVSASYDLSGNLIRFTDRKGQVTTISYDGVSHRTFTGYGTQSGSTYQSTVYSTFDAGDRLTNLTDSVSGAITRSYDGRDRLVTETTQQGGVSYTYDADERRSTMTVAGQPTVSYAYDAANRLKSISQGTTNVSIAYDALGRRTSMVLPNGISATYAYDTASQLTSLYYQGGSLTPGNLVYSYDMAGRRTGLGGSLASTQLPAALTSASYNGNNQLTQWGTVNPTYDANGSTLNDGTNTYTWDARNRLVSVNSATSSFTYDPLGRRTLKTTPAGTTGFLYDGVNSVQELTGSAPSANLLTGGVDERFIRTDSQGALSYITDVLGSTLALTDSNGASQVQYSYEPYGNVSASGFYTTNSYTYTGREVDGLGLIYSRARYYSPQTGRFLSEDPIGLAGGINKYAYVRADPISYTDPSGKDPLTGFVTGAIFGAVGALNGEDADGWDAFYGGLLGGLAGAGAAFYLPPGPLSGAAAGALGDLAGQEASNLHHHRSLGHLNCGEILGAGLGGAAGGGLGVFVDGLGASASLEGPALEWAKDILGGNLGLFSTLVGGKLGEPDKGNGTDKATSSRGWNPCSN